MRFEVKITQTEERTWVLDAVTEEAAIEQAQEWNENPSGCAPPGCRDYQYSFDATTNVRTEEG
jgi:hypothetical protein